LHFPIEIDVSRPSVTLRKRQQLKAFEGVTHALREIEVSRPSLTPQHTVTLHRDTSIHLGGCEVSRPVWVWTSFVRPLALTLATTTLALDGLRITTSTAIQNGTVLIYRGRNKPALGPLGGSAIWGR
jgi:hypothetical protein